MCGSAAPRRRRADSNPGAIAPAARELYIPHQRHAGPFGPRSHFQAPNPHEASQHCHHRPCRSWENHAGRPAAPAVGRFPRQPARGGARDGFQRSRARARHHHPRQGDLDRLGGHAHQYRRYARPCRFRRRGGAHSQHGRRRARAGRCGRGTSAADQVRRVEGAQEGAQAHRGDQQGGPRATRARRRW